MARAVCFSAVLSAVAAILLTGSGCTQQPAAGPSGRTSAAANPADKPDPGGTPDSPVIRAPDKQPTEPKSPATGLGKTAGGKADGAGPGTKEPGTDKPGGQTPGTKEPGTKEPGTKTPGTPGSAKPPKLPEREELFKGWPKPRVALFVTGRQHGYLEPCGCAGLSNQKGGLARRHSLQTQLKEQGWPLVMVDVGNQVRRFGRQPELQFQISSQGFRKMDYSAVTLGPDDLRLSFEEVFSLIVGNEGGPQFISANVTLLEEAYTPKLRIVEAGGTKIGITAILGDEFLEEIRADEIITASAEAGLKEVWPKLEAAKCDYYVLLAHTSIENSQALGRKFPKFDVIVTAGGAGEPTNLPEPIEGSKAVIIQAGTKGMYAGVVGFFDDPQQPLRYQRVPLDSRFKDSTEMLKLLADYQQALKAAGLEGLGVKQVPHPSKNRFIGSEACGECHTKAFKIWQGTPHFHATESLVHPGERTEIPRHFDPECLSCHVTGWNPQKFYPFESGYLSLEGSKPLHGVGCESCHGPGSKHAAAENGDIDVSEVQLAELRKSMVLAKAIASEHCVQCHDPDNSPDFDFPTYWPRVEHVGRD